MMVFVLFKKLLFHFLSIVTLFVTTQTPAFALDSYDPYVSGQTAVANLIANTYQFLGLKDKPGQHIQTPTLAYLDRADLRTHLNICNNKIQEIGLDFFKDLFKSIVKREVDFTDNYRVFYHGQRREFVVPQDLYKGLYEITYKKSLIDFIMVRVPNKNFGAFKCIKDFLYQCIKNGDIKNGSWFDEQSHIKTRLLSVNPSLFGNSCNGWWGGECSFAYFLDSFSISQINILNLVEEVFDIFNYKKYFSKYKKDIIELNSLLSAFEQTQTGALLQVFIPKKLVDSVAYRCNPGGFLYYNDNEPENHPASKDLDDYKKGTIGIDSLFDETQFRILINQTMLDPQSGIKYFRYCNETEKMKEYQTKLKQLLDKISADLVSNLKTSWLDSLRQ